MVSKCFSKMQSSKSRTPMMGPSFPHYSHQEYGKLMGIIRGPYKFHGFGLRNCMADPTSRTGPKELARNTLGIPRQFASLHKTSHAYLQQSHSHFRSIQQPLWISVRPSPEMVWEKICGNPQYFTDRKQILPGGFP